MTPFIFSGNHLGELHPGGGDVHAQETPRREPGHAEFLDPGDIGGSPPGIPSPSLEALSVSRVTDLPPPYSRSLVSFVSMHPAATTSVVLPRKTENRGVGGNFPLKNIIV